MYMNNYYYTSRIFYLFIIYYIFYLSICNILFIIIILYDCCVTYSTVFYCILLYTLLYYTIIYLHYKIIKINNNNKKNEMTPSTWDGNTISLFSHGISPPQGDGEPLEEMPTSRGCPESLALLLTNGTDGISGISEPPTQIKSPLPIK